MLSTFLLILVPEETSRRIGPGYSEKLLDADGLTWVSKTLESLKGRLEA